MSFFMGLVKPAGELEALRNELGRGAGGGEEATTPRSQTLWGRPPSIGGCTITVVSPGRKVDFSVPGCDGTKMGASGTLRRGFPGDMEKEGKASSEEKEKQRFEAPPSTLEKALLPGPSLLGVPEGVAIIVWS